MDSAEGTRLLWFAAGIGVVFVLGVVAVVKLSRDVDRRSRVQQPRSSTHWLDTLPTTARRLSPRDGLYPDGYRHRRIPTPGSQPQRSRLGRQVAPEFQDDSSLDAQTRKWLWGTDVSSGEDGSLDLTNPVNPLSPLNPLNQASPLWVGNAAQAPLHAEATGEQNVHHRPTHEGIDTSVSQESGIDRTSG